MNLLNDKKVGIALSGGGTRGAFHPGFLKGISTISDKIAAVAGTSIGSVIGVFYCAGYSPDQIIEFFKEQSIFKLLHIVGSQKGFMELKGLKKVLEQKIPKDFDDLKIPLKVVATNLSKDQEMVLDSGDLHEAVIASCSIPILFQAVQINGNECVDGGLLNNLPASTIRDDVDSIIGIHVNKYHLPEISTSMRMMADRIFSLVIRQNVLHSKKNCDFLIEPELTYSSVLDFDKIDEFYERGVSEGQDFIREPENFKIN